jgi:hypothetical protein
VRQAVLVAGLIALSACGPVSQETAERQCFERARLAQQPRGEVAVGFGSEGMSSSVEIAVSDDFLLGRDPVAVYETCVVQKTGVSPIQSLAMREAARG